MRLLWRAALGRAILCRRQVMRKRLSVRRAIRLLEAAACSS